MQLLEHGTYIALSDKDYLSYAFIQNIVWKTKRKEYAIYTKEVNW